MHRYPLGIQHEMVEIEDINKKHAGPGSERKTRRGGESEGGTGREAGARSGERGAEERERRRGRRKISNGKLSKS